MFQTVDFVGLYYSLLLREASNLNETKKTKSQQPIKRSKRSIFSINSVKHQTISTSHGVSKTLISGLVLRHHSLKIRLLLLCVESGSRFDSLLWPFFALNVFRHIKKLTNSPRKLIRKSITLFMYCWHIIPTQNLSNWRNRPQFLLI